MHVWVVLTNDDDVIAVLEDPDQLEECLRAWFWASEIEHRETRGLDDDEWIIWGDLVVEPRPDAIFWDISYLPDPAGRTDFRGGWFQGGRAERREVWHGSD